jgi:hypothetical protein
LLDPNEGQYQLKQQRDGMMKKFEESFKGPIDADDE